MYTSSQDIKQLKLPVADSYKSQNGELFVYAGSQHFHGAPLMAIKAASKLIGAIFFYTNPENRDLVKEMRLRLQEFIVTDDNNMEKYAGYANAFLFGPGLEANLPTKAIISALLRNFPEKPAVIDAYAIAVANEKGLLKNKILTPHKGELRHIFGEEGEWTNMDNNALTKLVGEYACKNECYILLKGEVDTLFHKNGEIVLNRTGNAGMAKGGTGDILAGVLGALLTQNDPWIALKAATYITGKAGDNLYERLGYNYSATDMIPEIQKVMHEARNV